MRDEPEEDNKMIKRTRAVLRACELERDAGRKRDKKKQMVYRAGCTVHRRGGTGTASLEEALTGLERQ